MTQHSRFPNVQCLIVDIPTDCRNVAAMRREGLDSANVVELFRTGNGMDRRRFETAADEFLSWCNALLASAHQCVEDAKQSSADHVPLESDRIVERVMDFMGRFDLMLLTLEKEPVFKPALDALRSTQPGP